MYVPLAERSTSTRHLLSTKVLENARFTVSWYKKLSYMYAAVTPQQRIEKQTELKRDKAQSQKRQMCSEPKD